MQITKFVIRFLIWNEKANFKKHFSFSNFEYQIKNEKRKQIFFKIYFDLKPISKNQNQNFRIPFSIWNLKMNFKKIFHFSILVLKLANEKWKFLKIRFVFKSKNELYFWYTDYFRFCICFSFSFLLLFFIFVFVFVFVLHFRFCFVFFAFLLTHLA